MRSLAVFAALSGVAWTAAAGAASVKSAEAMAVIDRAMDVAAHVQVYAAEANNTYLTQEAQGAADDSIWVEAIRRQSNETVAFRAPNQLWSRRVEDSGKITVIVADGTYHYQFSTAEPQKIAKKTVEGLGGRGWDGLPDLTLGLLSPLTAQVGGLGQWRADEAVAIAYKGHQLVGGVPCEGVEFTVPIHATRWAQAREKNPSLPKAPGSATHLYYIGIEDGLLRRRVDSTEFPGVSRTWSETNYSVRELDPQQSFTYERLASEAKSSLGDQPFPPVVEVFNDVGRPLPELQATLYDGGELDWRDYHGQVLVVETWATWCGYCKEAMPYYEKMRQTLIDQGVVFMALNFEQEQDQYARWVQDNRERYGFVFARAQTTRENWQEVLHQFKGSLPAFYVVGRDGKVISGYSGYGYAREQPDPRLLAALAEAGIRL